MHTCVRNQATLGLTTSVRALYCEVRLPGCRQKRREIRSWGVTISNNERGFSRRASHPTTPETTKEGNGLTRRMTRSRRAGKMCPIDIYGQDAALVGPKIASTGFCYLFCVQRTRPGPAWEIIEVRTPVRDAFLYVTKGLPPKGMDLALAASTISRVGYLSLCQKYV